MKNVAKLLKTAQKRIKESKDNYNKEFKFPTTEELYKNKVEEIVIKPQWYDVRENVFDFYQQLFAGYLWECKFGNAFWARHDESPAVERMLQQMESLKARRNDSNLKDYRWAPNHDEEEELLLVDIARMIPRMWD